MPGRRPLARAGLPAVVGVFLLLVVLPAAANVGPIYLTALRGFLLVMVLPLLGGLLAGRYGRINLLDIAVLAHVFWMFLAFAFTTPQAMVGFVGSLSVEVLGGYLIARAYIRDKASFVALCKALALMAVCMLPLAVFEALTGNPIVISTIERLPVLRSVEIIRNPPRMGLERAQVLFAHPIHFGLFCSVAFSMTFVALQGVLGTTRRYMLSAVIVACTFLSLSSGALLALVMQLFLIGWYVALRKVQARWWILFGLAVVMYVVVDLLSTRTPVRVFMSYATFSSHNAYWRAVIFEWGVFNVLGSPENGIPPARMFGIGMADWMRPHWMHSPSVDNFWLLLAMRFGIPGLLSFAIGYVWLLFKVGRRRDLDGDPQFLNMRRAWMFTFIGLSFTLSTVHVWTNMHSFVVFLLAAGVWMIDARPDRPAGGPDNTDGPDGDTDGGAEDDSAGGLAGGLRRYSRFPPHAPRTAGA